MKNFFPLFRPGLLTVSSLAGSPWTRHLGGASGARIFDHVDFEVMDEDEDERVYLSGLGRGGDWVADSWSASWWSEDTWSAGEDGGSSRMSVDGEERLVSSWVECDEEVVVEDWEADAKNVDNFV
jgi:hypothetical protein